MGDSTQMPNALAHGKAAPDFAEFTLGRTEGATRGLHPGYALPATALRQKTFTVQYFRKFLNCVFF
jgi:hypothetical protein